MQDMLVRLYDLPPLDEAKREADKNGVTIRRAAAPEKIRTVEWVNRNFTRVWASETDVAFSNAPVTCFVAVHNGDLVGFACHEVTCKNFFGPTGVLADHRGLGIGRALLLEALWDQRHQGYAYSIIAGVGPAGFYRKAVGAQLIDGSTPGFFDGLLLD